MRGQLDNALEGRRAGCEGASLAPMLGAASRDGEGGERLSGKQVIGQAAAAAAPGACKERRLVVASIWVTLVHAVCLAVVVALVFVSPTLWVGVRRGAAAAAAARLLCMPCAELRHPGTAEATLTPLTRKRSGRRGRCCASTKDQLLLLVQLLIEKRISEEARTGSLDKTNYVYVDRTNGSTYISTNKPVGHVIAMQQPENATQPGLILWNPADSLAYQRNGMTYRAGRLVVPQTGVYQVYSHLHFLETRDCHAPLRSTRYRPAPWCQAPIGHHVYRYNLLRAGAGGEKLMESVQSRHASRAFADRKSFVAGAVRLRRGDELYVTVSNVSLSSINPRVSYFGLFQV